MNTAIELKKCKHGIFEISCQICNPKPLLKTKPKKIKIAKQKTTYIFTTPNGSQIVAEKTKAMTKREYEKMCKGCHKDFSADHNHDFPGEEIPDDVWWDMAAGMLYGPDGDPIRAYIRKRANGNIPWNADKYLYISILADDLYGE